MEWVPFAPGMNLASAPRLLHHSAQACSESGARVVAMTNTENAWSIRGSGEVERVKLNVLIREYIARHSGDSGAVLVDLGETGGVSRCACKQAGLSYPCTGGCVYVGPLSGV